jgi:hypothetical protein
MSYSRTVISQLEVHDLHLRGLEVKWSLLSRVYHFSVMFLLILNFIVIAAMKIVFYKFLQLLGKEFFNWSIF